MPRVDRIALMETQEAVQEEILDAAMSGLMEAGYAVNTKEALLPSEHYSQPVDTIEVTDLDNGAVVQFRMVWVNNPKVG